MGQHPLDLGLAAYAKHAAHDPVQIGGGRHPAARLAFRKAAVIDELDLEPAECRRRLEHLALDTAGAVPGRLAAGGGVQSKDQPSATASRMRRRRLLQLVEKIGDLGRVPLGWKPVVVLTHACPHAGLSQTEVSWNTAPPRGRPGSALVSKLIPIPSSNA